METFKERLMRFVKSEYNEGQKAFEKRCGLSNGQINKMDNGTNTSTLAKIAEVCPQLNLRWLLLGKGEMIAGDKTASPEHNVSMIGSAQAVFIANWSDIEPVMEKVVSKVMGGK
jgi:hypothetical protein